MTVITRVTAERLTVGNLSHATGFVAHIDADGWEWHVKRFDGVGVLGEQNADGRGYIKATVRGRVRNPSAPRSLQRVDFPRRDAFESVAWFGCYDGERPTPQALYPLLPTQSAPVFAHRLFDLRRAVDVVGPFALRRPASPEVRRALATFDNIGAIAHT